VHIESGGAKRCHSPIAHAHFVNNALRSRRSHCVAAFAAGQLAQVYLDRRFVAHRVGDDLRRGFGAQRWLGFGAGLLRRLRSNSRKRIGLWRHRLRERRDARKKTQERESRRGPRSFCYREAQKILL
jgi:hypothetical protein